MDDIVDWVQLLVGAVVVRIGWEIGDFVWSLVERISWS